MEADLCATQGELAHAQISHTHSESEVARLSKLVVDSKREGLKSEQQHEEAIAAMKEHVSSLRSSLDNKTKQAQVSLTSFVYAGCSVSYGPDYML